MKYLFLLLFQLPLVFLMGQEAGIVNVEFMASGVLNGERIAWSTKVARVHIDKSTGVIQAFINVDDFTKTTENTDFVEGVERDQNKEVVFTWQLPIFEVKDNLSRPINAQAEVTIKYNGLQVRSPFDFTMLVLIQQGYSIMGQGYFHHDDLEIEGLSDLDDELYITCRIIGRGR